MKNVLRGSHTKQKMEDKENVMRVYHTKQKTEDQENVMRVNHRKQKTGEDKENVARGSHHKARGGIMAADVGVAVWAVVGSLLLTITASFAMSDAIIDQEVTVVVDGVEGESASVPCDLFPTDPKDKVNLILWYKDDGKDPIYRLRSERNEGRRSNSRLEEKEKISEDKREIRKKNGNIKGKRIRKNVDKEEKKSEKKYHFFLSVTLTHSLYLLFYHLTASPSLSLPLTLSQPPSVPPPLES